MDGSENLKINCSIPAVDLVRRQTPTLEASGHIPFQAMLKWTCPRNKPQVRRCC